MSKRSGRSGEAITSRDPIGGAGFGADGTGQAPAAVDSAAFLNQHNFDPLLVMAAAGAAAGDVNLGDQALLDNLTRKERKRQKRERRTREQANGGTPMDAAAAAAAAVAALANEGQAGDPDDSSDSSDDEGTQRKRKKTKNAHTNRDDDIPVLGYDQGLNQAPMMAPSSSSSSQIRKRRALQSQSQPSPPNGIPIDPVLTGQYDAHPEGLEDDGEAIAAAAVAALAASACSPDRDLTAVNVASATQEELVAALRALNPNLRIEDLNSGGRAHGKIHRLAPDLSVPQMIGQNTDPAGPHKVIASVPHDPAHSRINKTLMQSMVGMTHADVLSTKWLSTVQLKELIDTQDLEMKKGQFSQTEKTAIDAAIQQYSRIHNLDEAALQDVIFVKGKAGRGQYGDFFPTLARSIEKRPLVAVYNFVKRAYNPLSKQGPWTEEEDQRLLDAVEKFGSSAWENIGGEVGRTKSDCRDRWRNHLSVKETKKSGKWTEEEEEKLREVVHRVTIDQGRSTDQDVFWTTVSKEMGGSRSRAQCRIKWLDSMNLKEKHGGDKAWTHRDTLILAQRLLKIGMVDDTGFNWHSIEDHEWGGWSAHLLQRRWRKIKEKAMGKKHKVHLTIPEVLQRVISDMNEKAEEELDAPLRAPAATRKPLSADLLDD